MNFKLWYFSIFLMAFLFNTGTIEGTSIRIGLKKTKNPVVLSSTHGLKIYRENGTYIRRYKSQEQACFSINSRNLLECSGFSPFRGFSVRPISNNGKLTLNGSEYRGDILLTIENNEIQVINRLDIEEYLYGLVGREMSPKAPIEALKTQAVIARTFALRNINRHKSSGYDLCADTHCQAYSGTNRENENIIRAVNYTKSRVLKYNGEYAATVYCASCGGWTASNGETWNGKQLPYLLGRKDSWCLESSHFEWKYSISLKELEKLFVDSGYNCTGIKTLKITDTTSSGRVKEIVVECEDSPDFTVTGGKIRSVVGAKNIKSLRFDVGSGNKPVFVEPEVKEDGKRLFFERIKKIREKLEAEVQIRNIIQSSRKIENTDEIYFSGRGFGHGVGLCQEGAKKMAENGRRFADILKYYYPGTILSSS